MQFCNTFERDVLNACFFNGNKPAKHFVEFNVTLSIELNMMKDIYGQNNIFVSYV